MTWAELKAKQRLERAEWLRAELDAVKWNVVRCAASTGMPRCDIYKYIDSLGIQRPAELPASKAAHRGNWQGLQA